MTALWFSCVTLRQMERTQKEVFFNNFPLFRNIFDKMWKFIFYLSFLLGGSISIANGERTHNKMYDSIAGASCFRRLNGTHQTGCSSTMSGSVGVLHVIKEQSDFDFILYTSPSPPYAPVIPPHLFTRENILRLKNEAKSNVSAIVLINQINYMSNFSHELTCSNSHSGILTNRSESYCEIESSNNPSASWNPFGTGLLHEDFPFPIYYTADLEEINKMLECFEKFNNYDFGSHPSRPLCSIQINSFMSAAANSEICMRRTQFVNNLSPTKFCDPLEDKNIYSTLFPRKAEKQKLRAVDKNEKFILLSSRLDTTSMFDGVGLGAMDSLVPFATLINIAHVLTELLSENEQTNFNVLFMLFNGESYDFIGSQKFVYDLNNLTFPPKNTYTSPINLDSIELMIDLNTMDDLHEIKLFHATNFPHVKTLLNYLNYYDETYKLNVSFRSSGPTKNLPPASAQSFLRDNITFPAIILSSKPINPYYHSIFDDDVHLGYNYGNTGADFTKLMTDENAKINFTSKSIQMKIRNVSSALSFSIYSLLTGKNYNGEELANPVLVDEFLNCFLKTAMCPLFNASSPPHSLPWRSKPPLRYVSVGSMQEASGWAYRILGFLTSRLAPNIAKENCTHLPLYWFYGYKKKGECRYTSHNYSHAISPAFLETDYDWKSGRYSTWTESTWQPFSARIFLRPSKIHETVTLSIGFIVMLMSFIIVFLINSQSDILFETVPTASSFSQPAAC